MNSSETVIAPAPKIEHSQMQADLMPTVEELTYTYQRADGTVERARNAEDAIARCPVLGKLAIEAPDQASILLELAAMGNEKMAADVKVEPQQFTTQTKHSEPKPAKAVDSKRKLQDSVPEQITKIEQPIIVTEALEARQPVIKLDKTASLHADTERIESNRQSALTAIQSGNLPNTGVLVHNEMLKADVIKKDRALSELPFVNKAEPVQPFEISKNRSADATSLILVEGVQRHNQDTEPQKNEVVIIRSNDSIELPDGYEAAETETPFLSGELGVPDITLSMDNDSSTELVYHEVEAALDENTELLFEPETIETYYEISNLIIEQMDSKTVSAVSFESENILTKDPAANFEQIKLNSFEAFKNTQPLSVETSLKTIRERSNEQSLEQTLVQLVEYISNSPDDIEQTEPLLAIIKDLEKSLSKYNFPQEAVKLQITPELTDQLLMLVRELGYQYPREVLVTMLHNFGYAFLIQSLAYLFQVAATYNRKEFLSISYSAPTSDDNQLVTISKLIFRMVMGKELKLDTI